VEQSGDEADGLKTYIADGGSASARGFPIPTAPSELRETRWLAYSESVIVAGIEIKKGFLYVGPALLSPSGATDPALIDPRKNVAATGQYNESHGAGCRSYATATPSARRAYLRWLADGRSAPDADIAFVYLYFYGLERRIILDVLRDGTGTHDFPNLYKELKRLYTLYAAKSPSFRRHCAQLIELVEVAGSEDKLYERDLVAFPTTLDFPFLIRLALGQAVAATEAIPAQLAFSWAEHEPSIVRPSAVTRHAAYFKKLFLLAYTARYGKGLVIAPNRTKLKLSYQPASRGLDGSGGVDMHFGEVPDVAASTELVKLLQELVNQCAQKLEPYSLYIGRNPKGRTTSESYLVLPFELWPEAAQFKLQTIKSLVGPAYRLFTVEELITHAGVDPEIGQEEQQGLLLALVASGLGIEPNLTGLRRVLESAERVVLFENNGVEDTAEDNGASTIARLSVELAAIIAHADGDFCERELDHLCKSIERWTHLAPPLRRRLQARACLLRASPVALSSMQRKIGLFDVAARAEIAGFAATMVLADGTASTAEVAVLEKIYQQLGLDAQTVYRDIHSPFAAGVMGKVGAAVDGAAQGQPFVLDREKIAALQSSSREIAERLAGIFNEEPEALVTGSVFHSASADAPTVLGLDPIHSKFARILTSRATWDRAELVDVALDLAMMLDGALERLNEASLDQYDMMFIEGDDPIEINPELVEKLT
jgi:tellurite resistance protein